jgi:hypothetical protein
MIQIIIYGATIVAYLAAGYFVTGLFNRWTDQECDSDFDFCVTVACWPIMLSWKMIGLYVLLPCGLGLCLLIIEFGPAIKEALAWANRGFQPPPPPTTTWRLINP